MPIPAPILDNRKYQDLVNEALARVPVHTPEWTNFNESDPGVTLVQLFAFLTENLLYRANRIPERNRNKFLNLLGLPLQPGAPAVGLVTFSNEHGPISTFTLNAGIEVRAGQVPFQTGSGLDVLPVEARVYYKREIDLQEQGEDVLEFYRQLYASYLTDIPSLADLKLYETIPMPPPAPGSAGVDLNEDTIDGLWVALLVRANDRPAAAAVPLARKALAGKTLSLGVVPWLGKTVRDSGPIGQALPGNGPRLLFHVPNGGSLGADRVPGYTSLPARAELDVLHMPGVIEVTLPGENQLALWNNLDPLEMGVDTFPPALEDTNLNDRLITWVRIQAPRGAEARLAWVGINAAPVTQAAHVRNEALPKGSGEPDQTAALAHKPVIAGSVRLLVTPPGSSEPEAWQAVDDLYAAAPEVALPDPRLPAGASQGILTPPEVFELDAEAGLLRFGDGTHGKRPPLDALLRVDYAYGMGSAGNVGPGSLNSSPALPAGIQVTNPVATWGGVDPETVTEGEKQIPRYLQHRDRLVTVRDFETITWRAPGVEIGRVEVFPAYHPLYSRGPGDAPGAVTLMLIPRSDPLQPDAPLPDRLFLETVCDYLDPRRLVTTELFLRPPTYKKVWVSVGFQPAPGKSTAQVREAIRAALRQFLSPLPAEPGAPDESRAPGPFESGPRGWPLGKPVIALELVSIVSRVAGVTLVSDVLLASEDQPGQSVQRVEFQGLGLPWLYALSVVEGSPAPLSELGALAPAQPGPPVEPGTPRSFLPVPVIPEECR